MLLAGEFKGGPLVPKEESPAGNNPQLEVFRSSGMSAAPTQDRAAFRL